MKFIIALITLFLINPAYSHALNDASSEAKIGVAAAAVIGGFSGYCIYPRTDSSYRNSIHDYLQLGSALGLAYGASEIAKHNISKSDGINSTYVVAGAALTTFLMSVPIVFAEDTGAINKTGAILGFIIVASAGAGAGANQIKMNLMAIRF